MDFHSLARRELQTLCKQNKIPANMTNIAMADALTALDIVEGIEEFLNPSESQTAQSSVESPEKAAITSSIAPRTGCRTSTRRKTVKEEPESSQSLTRSRRVTRRTIAAEVEETTPSTRKRVPAASARRKMETQLKEECEEDQKIGMYLKEATSVRRVYSTRGSVRLSEKKNSETNLKNTEAIKIESFCKEVSEDLVAKTNEGLDDLDKVSDDMCLSGVELQKISEEDSKNTNDLEVLIVQNLNAASENKRDSEDDQENNGDSYKDELLNKSVVEKSIDFENQVYDKDVGAEIFDESDIILGENVEKALAINDDVLEQSGSNDSEVQKLLSNTENPNELLKLENDMVLEDSAAAMFSFDVHGDETDAINPQSSVKVVNDLANFCASAADEDQNQDTELELPFQEDDDDIETDTELYEIEVLESKIAAAHSVLLPESGIQECEESEISDDQPIMALNNATEVSLFEIRVDNESDIQDVTYFSEVIADEPAMTTQTSHPVLDKTPACGMAWVGVHGSATHELLLPLENENTSASSVKWSPLLVPKASVTPGKKLSSKTPTKIQGIMSLVLDDKENIDNSGRKLDLTRENGKKKKNPAEDNGLKSLTDASLRQLTKMLKEKLQISNKVNNNINIDEEKNTAKVERARPALQRLPENQLAMGGPEKEN